VHVALLRAVNVGGTGLLPMSDLRLLCEEIVLRQVRTYIQSGNVVFESDEPEPLLGKRLEQALETRMGRCCGVVIRNARQMRAILDANPFAEAQPSQVGVVFLATPLPPGSLAGLVIPGREQVHPHGREIFVHYPDGMGRSKLKLPGPAAQGTARNLNTVGKLVAMMQA
jgi:uncharacterized protein (DUF1697 family)